MATMTAAQLAQVRSQRAASFQESASVRRAVDSADGRGGYTQGWTTVHATVACSVTTPSRSGAGTGGFVPVDPADRAAQIAFPVGTTIKGGDRVIVAGVTWEVVQVDQPGSMGVQVGTTCVQVSA